MKNYQSAMALFVLLALTNLQLTFAWKVIYAVNCGGLRQISSNNIIFEKDPGPIDNNLTTTCDHGMTGYIPYCDGVIFRTVRKDYYPFTYQMPIVDDGNYVAIFKYFESKDMLESEDQRLMSVHINGICAIEDLNLRDDHCCEMPVEVHIPIVVQGENLFIQEESTGITGKIINVRFSKRGNLECIISGILLVKLEDGEKFPKKSWLATQDSLDDGCDDRILQCLNELKAETP
jgi:hypothetical protein